MHATKTTFSTLLQTDRCTAHSVSVARASMLAIRWMLDRPRYQWLIRCTRLHANDDCTLEWWTHRQGSSTRPLSGRSTVVEWRRSLDWSSTLTWRLTKYLEVSEYNCARSPSTYCCCCVTSSNVSVSGTIIVRSTSKRTQRYQSHCMIDSSCINSTSLILCVDFTSRFNEMKVVGYGWVFT